jgi:hypothetical protein
MTMYRVKVQWKAYPMDRGGIKTCQRGEVVITSQYLVNVHDLLELTRQQVWDEHPDLRSTPIHLVEFRIDDQEVA